MYCNLVGYILSMLTWIENIVHKIEHLLKRDFDNDLQPKFRLLDTNWIQNCLIYKNCKFVCIYNRTDWMNGHLSSKLWVSGSNPDWRKVSPFCIVF